MRVLRFRDLKASGLFNNRVTLARWIREQGFPRPLQLGENSLAWRADEIEAWLASRQRPAPEPESSESGDDPGGRERRRHHRPAA